MSSATEFLVEANNAEDALIIASTVKAKRTPRVKSLKAPQPLRNTIHLRPIQKAYIGNKRFRVSLDLAQVAYVLKNGNTITTEFVELAPIESNRLPEAQTYLKSEDQGTFAFAHTTTLFAQRDLDYVNVIDTEGNVIFCQEYGGSYR